MIQSQVQDKGVGSHSAYTACTNRAGSPHGKKTKSGGLVRAKKKKRQAGENKPRKCGHSQMAHCTAKSNWCGSFLSQMGGETMAWVCIPVLKSPEERTVVNSKWSG